jgi:hypothetical protein
MRKYTGHQNTMKVSITTILLLLSLNLLAQKKIAGRYRDYFGSRIELSANSTFKYTWHFDLSGSWTKGTWSLNNDTLYFHMIPTYDTISYKDNDGTSADKLILSVDETSERLTPEQYAAMGLSSGGQNLQPYPNKLFFKGQKLFTIKNGKLVKKKIKGFWTNKKWPPWYFKSED